MNLLDLVKDQVSGSLVSQASKFLGESETGVGKALGGVFPALLGKVIDKSEDSSSLGRLFDMAKKADDGGMDDISGLFSGGAANVANLMNNGSKSVDMLLGNSADSFISKISSFSGLSGSSTSSLIKMAAPFLMSSMGKQINSGSLDKAGFASWLGDQKDSVQAGIPGNLLSSLGSGFLGKGADIATGIANDGIDAGKKVVGGAMKTAGNVTGAVGSAASNVASGAVDVAGDAVNAGKKAGGSILKWLLPILLLLLVLGFLGRKGCSTGVDTIDNAAESVVSTTEGAAGAAVDEVKDAAGAVSDVAEGTIGAIGGLFGNINEAARTALDKITFATGSAGSQMMDFINGGFNGEGRVTFKHITFPSGKAMLDASTAAEVDNLAAILKTYPDITITLEGYTDNTGDANANVLLSQARANAVKARLVTQGIEEARIITKGLGAANPRADNSTDEGRAQNRRIELVINQ